MIIILVTTLLSLSAAASGADPGTAMMPQHARSEYGESGGAKPELPIDGQRDAGCGLTLSVGFGLAIMVLLHIFRLNKKLEASNRHLQAEIDKRGTMEAGLRKSETRLVQALKEAQAANEAKCQFLANTNHEIRTPMNGIIGMTGLLQSTRLTDEQQDYVDTIDSSANNLLRIINDILDYSRIESGDLDLETVEFDLHEVIGEAVDAAAAKAQAKGLEFIHIMDDEVPMGFAGDANRLGQVLNCLLDNAVKFTPQGEVFLHISLQKENDSYATIRFRVKDTGIGIDQDRVDRLFDSFTQADISHTRKYGGTGLGLAISQHLVIRMGGDIGVASTPDKGSEFWFTVKLKKQTGKGRRKPAIAYDFGTQRILIVEADDVSRHVLQGYLKMWNVRFAGADGAPKALAMLHRAVRAGDPFDLAVIDNQIPDISGEELGRMIREDPLLCGLKTIMLTSSGCQAEALRSQAAGFSAHLTKPVTIVSFFNCLSQVCTHSVAEPASTCPSPAAEPSGSPTILIVEDNPVNQKVTATILAKFGYATQVVSNGREAVEVLRRTTFDAVLMDLQMPEMDGFEATRVIRDPAGDCLNPRIPIIALTANVQGNIQEKSLETGMDDFLAKPVNPEDLIDTIRKWVEKFGEKRPHRNVQHPAMDNTALTYRNTG
jgi:signal transduction histidine kinase/CheY-like chemotaxis protein